MLEEEPPSPDSPLVSVALRHGVIRRDVSDRVRVVAADDGKRGCDAALGGRE